MAMILLAGCTSAPAESIPEPPSEAQETAQAAFGPGTVTGRAPAAVNGVPSVVILTPQSPDRAAPPATYVPYMDQVTLTFTPAVLFVRTGQPAEFRNSDDVLHNVRVREEATREGVFNVAIPTGGAYQYTFVRDGFYDVGCDIHPGMAAQVIATSTPHAVMADADGRFLLEGVEPGSYTLTIYYGAEKMERAVEVAGPATDLGQ